MITGCSFCGSVSGKLMCSDLRDEKVDIHIWRALTKLDKEARDRTKRVMAPPQESKKSICVSTDDAEDDIPDWMAMM